MGWRGALLRQRLKPDRQKAGFLDAGAESEPERQQKGAGEEFAEQVRREVGVEAVRVIGVDLDKELFFELRPGLREPLRFPFAKELDELSAGERGRDHCLTWTEERAVFGELVARVAQLEAVDDVVAQAVERADGGQVEIAGVGRAQSVRAVGGDRIV